MKIWLDNTGLHAGGRCLVGKAKSEVDVEGLVQLGCFIALGRSLHVNGFEDAPIATFTAEVKDIIESTASSGPPVVVEPSSSYRTACITAGKAAARELRSGFDVPTGNINDLKPSGVHPENVRRQVAFLRQVMDGAFVGNYAEIADNALEQKAVGAFDLMLASSEDLREVFRSLRSRRAEWSDDRLYAATAACRYHLNHELAHQVGAVAGPAVARARIVASRNTTVLEALDDSLRVAASAAAKRPVPTPPLFGTLVKKSRGEPSRLIQEARKLNAQLAKAVEAFESDLSHADSDTLGAAIRRESLAAEIRDSVARELKLKPKTKSPFGAEFVLLLGWMIPGVRLKWDGAAVKEWWAEKQSDRKYSVFSEVVAGTPEEVKQSREWDLLVRHSTARMI